MVSFSQQETWIKICTVSLFFEVLGYKACVPVQGGGKGNKWFSLHAQVEWLVGEKYNCMVLTRYTARMGNSNQVTTKTTSE